MYSKYIENNKKREKPKCEIKSLYLFIAVISDHALYT